LILDLITPYKAMMKHSQPKRTKTTKSQEKPSKSPAKAAEESLPARPDAKAERDELRAKLKVAEAERDDLSAKVKTAETERDELSAKQKAVEDEHARERERWVNERGELQSQAQAARDEEARLISELRGQLTTANEALETERRERKEENARAELALKQATASASTLRSQNASLEQQLTQVRARKDVKSGVLADLAGLLGDKIFGKGGSSRRDDD
jgi:chromosome segregation ATPase